MNAAGNGPTADRQSRGRAHEEKDGGNEAIRDGMQHRMHSMVVVKSHRQRAVYHVYCSLLGCQFINLLWWLCYCHQGTSEEVKVCENE
jgi:hypothetical protein